MAASSSRAIRAYVHAQGFGFPMCGHAVKLYCLHRVTCILKLKITAKPKATV